METINTIPVNYDSSDSRKSSKREPVKAVSLPFLEEENSSNVDPNTLYKTEKQIGKGYDVTAIFN
jgi:hypothetical protein